MKLSHLLPCQQRSTSVISPNSHRSGMVTGVDSPGNQNNFVVAATSREQLRLLQDAIPQLLIRDPHKCGRDSEAGPPTWVAGRISNAAQPATSSSGCGAPHYYPCTHPRTAEGETHRVIPSATDKTTKNTRQPASNTREQTIGSPLAPDSDGLPSPWQGR